jgi:hypothetical protein
LVFTAELEASASEGDCKYLSRRETALGVLCLCEGKGRDVSIYFLWPKRERGRAAAWLTWSFAIARVRRMESTVRQIGLIIIL